MTGKLIIITGTPSSAVRLKIQASLSRDKPSRWVVTKPIDKKKFEIDWEATKQEVDIQLEESDFVFLIHPTLLDCMELLEKACLICVVLELPRNVFLDVIEDEKSKHTFDNILWPEHVRRFRKFANVIQARRDIFNKVVMVPPRNPSTNIDDTAKIIRTFFDDFARIDNPTPISQWPFSRRNTPHDAAKGLRGLVHDESPAFDVKFAERTISGQCKRRVMSIIDEIHALKGADKWERVVQQLEVRHSAFEYKFLLSALSENYLLYPLAGFTRELLALFEQRRKNKEEEEEAAAVAAAENAELYEMLLRCVDVVRRFCNHFIHRVTMFNSGDDVFLLAIELTAASHRGLVEAGARLTSEMLLGEGLKSRIIRFVDLQQINKGSIGANLLSAFASIASTIGRTYEDKKAQMHFNEETTESLSLLASVLRSLIQGFPAHCALCKREWVQAIIEGAKRAVSRSHYLQACACFEVLHLLFDFAPKRKFGISRLIGSDEMLLRAVGDCATRLSLTFPISHIGRVSAFFSALTHDLEQRRLGFGRRTFNLLGDLASLPRRSLKGMCIYDSDDVLHGIECIYKEEDMSDNKDVVTSSSFCSRKPRVVKLAPGEILGAVTVFTKERKQVCGLRLTIRQEGAEDRIEEIGNVWGREKTEYTDERGFKSFCGVESCSQTTEGCVVVRLIPISSTVTNAEQVKTIVERLENGREKQEEAEEEEEGGAEGNEVAHPTLPAPSDDGRELERRFLSVVRSIAKLPAKKVADTKARLLEMKSIEEARLSAHALQVELEKAKIDLANARTDAEQSRKDVEDSTKKADRLAAELQAMSVAVARANKVSAEMPTSSTEAAAASSAAASLTTTLISQDLNEFSSSTLNLDIILPPDMLPQQIPEDKAREYVEMIQKQYRIQPPGLARTNLRGALKVLGADLYSSPIHFLEECIQNTVDCTFPASVTPSMCITLSVVKNCLVLSNNEIGFCPKNVRAICSLCDSTKVKGQSVGHKGLGFKSVFSVSRCVTILSNPWKFQFIIPENPRKNALEGKIHGPNGRVLDELSYVTPMLLSKEDEKELETTAAAAGADFQTKIILPLKPDIVASEFLEKAKNAIDCHILLFARKLDQLTVRHEITSSEVVETLFSRTSEADSNKLSTIQRDSVAAGNKVQIKRRIVCLKTEERKLDATGAVVGSSSSSRRFRVYWLQFEVPEHVCASDEQRGLKEVTRIALAFPLDSAAVGDGEEDGSNNNNENGDDVSRNQFSIYATLPVCSEASVPFLINADWSLVTSRESVKENIWNETIRDVAAVAFVEIAIRDEEVRRRLDRFTPQRNFATSAFWRAFVRRVNSELRENINLLYADGDGTSSSSSSTSSLPVSFRTANAEILDLVSEDDLKTHANVRLVTGSLGSVFNRDGIVPELSILDVLKCWENNKSNFASEVAEKQPTSWWETLFLLILKFSSRLEGGPSLALQSTGLSRSLSGGGTGLSRSLSGGGVDITSSLTLEEFANRLWQLPLFLLRPAWSLQMTEENGQTRVALPPQGNSSAFACRSNLFRSWRREIEVVGSASESEWNVLTQVLQLAELTSEVMIGTILESHLNAAVHLADSSAPVLSIETVWMDLLFCRQHLEELKKQMKVVGRLQQKNDEKPSTSPFSALLVPVRSRGSSALSLIHNQAVLPTFFGMALFPTDANNVIATPFGPAVGEENTDAALKMMDSMAPDRSRSVPPFFDDASARLHESLLWEDFFLQLSCVVEKPRRVREEDTCWMFPEWSLFNNQPLAALGESVVSRIQPSNLDAIGKSVVARCSGTKSGSAALFVLFDKSLLTPSTTEFQQIVSDNQQMENDAENNNVDGPTVMGGVLVERLPNVVIPRAARNLAKMLGVSVTPDWTCCARVLEALYKYDIRDSDLCATWLDRLFSTVALSSRRKLDLDREKVEKLHIFLPDDKIFCPLLSIFVFTSSAESSPFVEIDAKEKLRYKIINYLGMGLVSSSHNSIYWRFTRLLTMMGANTSLSVEHLLTALAVARGDSENYMKTGQGFSFLNEDGEEFFLKLYELIEDCLRKKAMEDGNAEVVKMLSESEITMENPVTWRIRLGELALPAIPPPTLEDATSAWKRWQTRRASSSSEQRGIIGGDDWTPLLLSDGSFVPSAEISGAVVLALTPSIASSIAGKLGKRTVHFRLVRSCPVLLASLGLKYIEQNGLISWNHMNNNVEFDESPRINEIVSETVGLPIKIVYSHHFVLRFVTSFERDMSSLVGSERRLQGPDIVECDIVQDFPFVFFGPAQLVFSTRLRYLVFDQQVNFLRQGISWLLRQRMGRASSEVEGLVAEFVQKLKSVDESEGSVVARSPPDFSHFLLKDVIFPTVQEGKAINLYGFFADEKADREVEEEEDSGMGGNPRVISLDSGEGNEEEEEGGGGLPSVDFDYINVQTDRLFQAVNRVVEKDVSLLFADCSVITTTASTPFSGTVNNERLQEVGRLGETFVYQLLSQTLGASFDPIRAWVSSNRHHVLPKLGQVNTNDGAGYDFHVTDEGSSIFGIHRNSDHIKKNKATDVYIEVKGCAGPWDGVFHMSENERRMAASVTEGVYMIWIVDNLKRSDQSRCIPLDFSSADVKRRLQFNPESYRVVCSKNAAEDVGAGGGGGEAQNASARRQHDESRGGGGGERKYAPRRENTGGGGGERRERSYPKGGRGGAAGGGGKGDRGEGNHLQGAESATGAAGPIPNQSVAMASSSSNSENRIGKGISAGRGGGNNHPRAESATGAAGPIPGQNVGFANQYKSSSSRGISTGRGHEGRVDTGAGAAAASSFDNKSNNNGGEGVKRDIPPNPEKIKTAPEENEDAFETVTSKKKRNNKETGGSNNARPRGANRGK